MTRLLSITGLIALALLLVGGAVALLAYGPEPTRDGRVEIPGLDAEASVTWIGDAMPVIEAETEAGVWTALGYAHGADHAWAMGLWRQAATGRLATWIGEDGAELDRHARQLAFGDVARSAYGALSPEDREAVDAYARGVSQAFADPAVAERDELIRLGVELDPWQPWHALAIERMMAWIGTAPLGADSVSADLAKGDEGVAFARADSAFRATLALGGFEHARAYSAASREGEAVVVHQPYGASALPLLTGATIRFAGWMGTVATVPGTLILASGGGDWAVLLTSDARLIPDDGPAPPPAFSRITGREGGEALTEVLRDSRGLVLRAPTAPEADTLGIDAEGRPVLSDVAPEPGVRLTWTGYAPVADIGAWRALLRREPPTFRLWRGDGLLRGDGALSVLGAPPVARSDSGWTFVGGHPTSALATLRFATLARGEQPPTARNLALDTGSPWSVSQVRPLIRGLGNRDSLSLELQDAFAFLRGWDGLYTADAVAPTIAEAWIDAHRRVFDRDPDPRQRLDSLLVRQTLRLGLAQLRDTLGTTAGTWTWERWGGSLRYPLFTEGRYVPLASRAGGHPTALLPAPSLVLDGPPGSAVFSMWTVGGGTTSTSRPSVGRGAPRDGRDPILHRLWRSPEADDATLRLIPAR